MSPAQNHNQTAHYCPKCGSQETLDFSAYDANSPNPTPMFCKNCHALGTKEHFSSKPRPWTWRFWQIKVMPLVIALGVSLFLPFQTTARVLIGIVLYIFLFCITWRRADGKRVFPPYLW